MNPVSIIPAPVAAQISGPGSFFGSCQVAANNFEPFFQSAIADNGTSFNLKTFSEFLDECGENNVLKNLQEILGEKAGAEAFELALLVAKNGDAFAQASSEDQKDILCVFKIMDMAETPFNALKGLLEDWVEKVKNILGDMKIEFKQPEEPISETEEDVSVAASFDDTKNMKPLPTGIKPKDARKFKALINSLLKNGLITPQEIQSYGLEETKKIVSAPVREFIKELWELVKNEPETEIENSVNKEIASLIEENISNSAKENISNQTKENISGSAKENISNSAKENVSSPIMENISNSVKENVPSFIKENISNSANENVSSFVKKNISGSEKEEVSGSMDENVIGSEKEETSDSIYGNVIGSVKEEISGSMDEKIIGSVKEEVFISIDEKAISPVKKGSLLDEKKSSPVEDSQEPEKVELVQLYLLLLKKKKRKSLEDGDEAEEEKGNELAIEVEEDEESDSKAKDKISLEEQDEELNLLDTIIDSKKAEKNIHKIFRAEMQQASQIQRPQQTLQIEPQQMRQTPQVQPEIRVVWDAGDLKVETVNPKTGEKLQTRHEAMPQKMQERINEFEVVRQVVSQAKFITTPTGEQKMTIQLRPEHLGQVDLRITLNHGEMQVHARVESATAQSALESHIGLLREGLEKQGINLERLEVSVEQRDKQDAFSLAERQEQHERHSKGRHHRGKEMRLAVSVKNDEKSDTGRRLGYNTMEYLA